MQLTTGKWQNCTKDTKHAEVFTLTNRFEGSSSNKLRVLLSHLDLGIFNLAVDVLNLSCAYHHIMKKTSPFKTRGRKIHSNRNILHKQLRRGSVEHLSCTIQKPL